MNQDTVTTLKFAFPQNVNVNNAKVFVNNGRVELILYVNEDVVEDTTANLTDMGLLFVPKTYVLHISTKDKFQFDDVFGDIPREVRNSDFKYITKVTVNSFDEVQHLLTKNNKDNGVIVQRYNNQYVAKNSPERNQFNRPPNSGYVRPDNNYMRSNSESARSNSKYMRSDRR